VSYKIFAADSLKGGEKSENHPSWGRSKDSGGTWKGVRKEALLKKGGDILPSVPRATSCKTMHLIENKQYSYLSAQLHSSLVRPEQPWSYGAEVL
jgi:hypothetical protein